MIDHTLVIIVLVGGTLGIITGIMIVDAWLWGVAEFIPQEKKGRNQ
jgi:cytosine/uracil/thiamine/allantoin permease